MKLIEADADFAADGSLKLLTPPPGWWKAGRQHIVVVLSESSELKGDSLMDYLLSEEGVVLPEVDLELVRSRVIENRETGF